jgi:hypothetical protein
MDEPPPTSPHQPRTPLRSTSAPVPGFPSWTHAIATTAFLVWWIGTDAYDYGIDLGYGWQSFAGPVAPLVAVVLLFVLPPAVALEAAAVLAGYRWIARVVVICYVVVAGFITFLPAGIRFFGDTSPTPIDLVTSSSASFGIVIGAQVIVAYLVCRHWLRWRTPR